MLRLTTAAGERLEIPAASITVVARTADAQAGCLILYDLGNGPATEKLTDAYGYVKKAAVDCLAMVNPVEVRTPERIDGQDEPAYGLLFFSRDSIVSRREVRGRTDGVNAIVHLNVTGSPKPYLIADTLDEMDGIADSANARADADVSGLARGEHPILPTTKGIHHG